MHAGHAYAALYARHTHIYYNRAMMTARSWLPLSMRERRVIFDGHAFRPRRRRWRDFSAPGRHELAGLALLFWPSYQ